jgi:hypothetical protein
MWFDDMGHLSARLSANCLRQTAYLLLAEMSRVPINPWTRSKRDDRLEGHARGAGTSGCYGSCQPTPVAGNHLAISGTVRINTIEVEPHLGLFSYARSPHALEQLKLPVALPKLAPRKVAQPWATPRSYSS